MRKIICALLIGFICLSVNVAFSAEAGPGTDGNGLLARCNDVINTMDNPSFRDHALLDLNVGYCTGLIQGIMDLNTVYEVRLRTIVLFCLPKLTNLQVVRVVVKYLKEHPEKLHEHESMLAISALKEAFPCK